MSEIWLPIAGFEGLYEISNIGRVRSSRRNKVMKLNFSHGYLRVRLQYKGHIKSIAVHCLVALAFIPNPLNLPEVNHDDLDKTNNEVGNLEWTTPKGNMAHAVANGRLSGKTNPRKAKKLTYDLVTQIRVASKAGASSRDLASLFGVDRRNISKIVKGESWA
jgi:NUMOD4 motif